MTGIPYIRLALMGVRPAGVMEMGSAHGVKKQQRRAPSGYSFRRIRMHIAGFFQTMINACEPKASQPCSEYKKRVKANSL